MHYPRVSSHNSPPIFLVGSDRIGLQKEDARYGINQLSHMLKWGFEGRCTLRSALGSQGPVRRDVTLLHHHYNR